MTAAPRSLLASFNVELLSTTDAATSDLAAHAAIARAPGVSARVVPTLRPDALFKVGAPGFLGLLQQLNAVSGVEVSDYDSFLVALRQRRRAFVDAGALATDHGVNDLGATPIAPLSTLVHWKREFERWTNLYAVVYHGTEEDRIATRQIKECGC